MRFPKLVKIEGSCKTRSESSQQAYGPYGEHFIDTVFQRQHSIPSTLNNERFPNLTGAKQKKLQKARTILGAHLGRGRGRRPRGPQQRGRQRY